MVVNTPFARAMLLACLSAFGALCYLVAALLVILLAVSFARGDGANAIGIGVAAMLFAALGVLSRRVAGYLS